MLDDLISVSGLPGLYKMVTNRPNGLIVEDIESGKRRFCSVRKHQFTPLGSIAIYTILDTIPLKDVLKTMHGQQQDIPLPDEKADKNELQSYFVQIVPQYDTERVYASDIKKLVKWFRFLVKHQLMDSVLADEIKDEEE
jgi:hypothetical protein